MFVVELDITRLNGCFSGFFILGVCIIGVIRSIVFRRRRVFSLFWSTRCKKKRALPGSPVTFHLDWEKSHLYTHSSINSSNRNKPVVNSAPAQGPGVTSGREEAGAPGSRGLSNSNKVPVVLIRNVKTGEYQEIDRNQSRLSRMRKRVFAWADALKPYLSSTRYRKVMITLTYARVGDWRPNQIRNYNKALKRRLGSGLIGMAMVSELQERGAVHYHLELIVKKGTYIPKPDKSGMWRYGSSRIETAKTIYYICSYLKKEYQKTGEFPKGLRMFSVWISKDAINKMDMWRFRLSSLPSWLCEEISKLEQGLNWRRGKPGTKISWWYGNKSFRSPFVFEGLVFLPGLSP